MSNAMEAETRLSERLIAGLAEHAAWPMPTQAWGRLFNAGVLAVYQERPDIEGGQGGAARHVLLEVFRRLAHGGGEHRDLRAFLPLTFDHSPMLRPAFTAVTSMVEGSDDPRISRIRDLLQPLRLDAERSLIGIFAKQDGEATAVEAHETTIVNPDDLRQVLGQIEAELLSSSRLHAMSSGQEALVLCILLVNLLEVAHLLRTSQGPKPEVLRDRALQIRLFDLITAGHSSGQRGEALPRLLQALRDASRMNTSLGEALEALVQNLRAMKPGENLRSTLGFDRVVEDPGAKLKSLYLIRNGNPDHMASCPWLRFGDQSAVKTAISVHAFRRHFVQVEGAGGERLRLEAACLQGDRQAEVIQRLYGLYLDHCALHHLTPKTYGLRSVLLSGEAVLIERDPRR